MADDEGVTSLEGGLVASLVTVTGAAEVVPWGARGPAPFNRILVP